MNITPELITAASGCIAAATAFVVAIVSVRKNLRIEKALDEAKQRETYIICPNCKKKIPLSEISFRLPSGEVDNNLNGKPDLKE